MMEIDLMISVLKTRAIALQKEHDYISMNTPEQILIRQSLIISGNW
jgi:hypothetical protein